MQEEDGEYEDNEGENMYAESEDPYLIDKKYKCNKCGKSRMEKGSTLFAPFCCGKPMTLAKKLEHKFDFETITRKSIEKEQTLFPGTRTTKSSSKTKAAKAKKKPAQKAKKKLVKHAKKKKR